MYPFEIGDFVRHKLENARIKMIVCWVRKGKRLPIGCRWWDEEKRRFEKEWFSVEELEKW